MGNTSGYDELVGKACHQIDHIVEQHVGVPRAFLVSQVADTKGSEPAAQAAPEAWAGCGALPRPAGPEPASPQRARG